MFFALTTTYKSKPKSVNTVLHQNRDLRADTLCCDQNLHEHIKSFKSIPTQSRARPRDVCDTAIDYALRADKKCDDFMRRLRSAWTSGPANESDCVLARIDITRKPDFQGEWLQKFDWRN